MDGENMIHDTSYSLILEEENAVDKEKIIASDIVESLKENYLYLMLVKGSPIGIFLKIREQKDLENIRELTRKLEEDDRHSNLSSTWSIVTSIG